MGPLVTVEELRDIYQMVLYILWGGTRTLIHGCTIVSKLPFHCFLIPSFLSSVTVWICSLELRKGLGSCFLQTRNEGARNSFIHVLYKWVISDFYSRPHFCPQHLTSVLTLSYPQRLTCAFPEITFSNMMESSQFNTFLFQDLWTVLLVHF